MARSQPFLLRRVGWAVVTIARRADLQLLPVPRPARRSGQVRRARSTPQPRRRGGAPGAVRAEPAAARSHSTAATRSTASTSPTSVALARGDLGLSYAFRDGRWRDLLGEALVNTLWLVHAGPAPGHRRWHAARAASRRGGGGRQSTPRRSRSRCVTWASAHLLPGHRAALLRIGLVRPAHRRQGHGRRRVRSASFDAAGSTPCAICCCRR